jgi:hypothetical protein
VGEALLLAKVDDRYALIARFGQPIRRRQRPPIVGNANRLEPAAVDTETFTR